jgi:hypothetical protein
LDYEHIGKLLLVIERFNGPDLVNAAELLEKFSSLDTLIGIPLKPDLVPQLFMVQDLPLDTATALFSALALGAILSGETDYGRFCYDASTALASRCVGFPSFDLCLAYFLNHWYVLRAGTSNHARTIVAQTVQTYHDLSLHNGSCGVRGLHLYLFVYWSDQ